MPSQSAAPGSLITRDQAIQLALKQASALTQAQITEQSAAEDVRQARKAFLPKFSIPGSYTYNTPIPGKIRAGEVPTFEPDGPSYLNSNSVNEYIAGLGLAGDVDIAGKLRATLRRNSALLEAAHFGTDAALRTLIEATDEAYFSVALAVAKLRAAQQNLDAAESFERITHLLYDGGEVPEVDLIRARLQTAGRRDDLDQAVAAKVAAVEGLKSLIGYNVPPDFTVSDLLISLPQPGEVEAFLPDAVSGRPELKQLESEERASKEAIRIARADLLPQLSFNFNGGFDTDSLALYRLREHSGGLALFTLTIPVFDWGVARSRERQAQLQVQAAQAERAQTLRAFNQQFNAARAQAQTARDRIARDQGALKDAETNLATSIARYRAGEAQIVEVTDAQTTLAAQRSALSQALFDYQVALSRLRQATGK